MKHTLFFTFALVCSIYCFSPVPLSAQAVLHQEVEEIVKADIVRVLSTETREIEGTETIVQIQNVEARVLSGLRAGEIISFENEFVTLHEGDSVYLNRQVTISGEEYFMYKDVDRSKSLYVLIALFIGLVIVFAGKQGMQALLSLSVSVLAILFLLVPALLKGYDPVLMSLLIAGLILAIVLFGTHGMNARSLIAFGGTFGAVFITCIVAWIFVYSMRFTGLSSDASIYLNFSTQGKLDFAGLLLGSIIIGILGILDDVSITQASVVQELKSANVRFGFKELYTRAIRVGRDHVGSLVNTLALAYVGASLPLVLLFALADSEIGLTLNQEVFSVEFVRIIIGSIGLILAVPLTTLIAAWWFDSHEASPQKNSHHGHIH